MDKLNQNQLVKSGDRITLKTQGGNNYVLEFKGNVKRVGGSVSRDSVWDVSNKDGSLYMRDAVLCDEKGTNLFHPCDGVDGRAAALAQASIGNGMQIKMYSKVNGETHTTPPCTSVNLQGRE